MRLMVSGPVGRFSGATPEELEGRLNALAGASLKVLEKGYVPIVGVFQAYPMINLLSTEEHQLEILEKVYRSLMAECEALLVIGYSEGVQLKIDIFTAAGKPIYRSIDEVPDLR